jgi:hypothetical protein
MGQAAASMVLAKLGSTWPAGKQAQIISKNRKVYDLGFELVLRQSA